MVTVLVCNSIADELLAKIARVDPQVQVEDAAALLLREMPETLRPGQRPAPLRTTRPLAELLREAEVLLAPRRLPGDLAARAPRLRWIQLSMAGIEWLKETDVWKSDVLLTSARGINARPVAEYTLAVLFALSKDVRRLLENQGRRRWERFVLGQLAGKTLGVVGFGALGQEVARLASAVGLDALACSRARPEGMPPGPLRELYPPDRLHAFLARCDFVVLCVPLTEATRGMFGEREFQAMRDTAFLVNVARGEVVQEQALVHALRTGWIAGAALDVFEKEPLPVESPLWEMPNVIISGHVAGLFEGYDARVTDLFCDNLGRYLRNEPLVNVVDRARGY